jgi:hypothetical protein
VLFSDPCRLFLAMLQSNPTADEMRRSVVTDDFETGFAGGYRWHGPERAVDRPAMARRPVPVVRTSGRKRLAFYAVPASAEYRETNVPNGQTGGGRGIRTPDTDCLRITV